MDLPALIRLLQEMDHQQTVTDELGQREIAWYYWRDGVEDALGIERGTLDTGGADDWAGCTNQEHFHPIG